VMAVALVLLAPLIADAYDTPAMTLPMRLMGVVIFVQGMGNLFIALFQALGRLSHNVTYVLVKSVVETVSTILIVVAGAGVAGAVAGKAIGFGVAGILAAVLFIRLVGWPAVRDAKGSEFSARRIAGYGALLVIINGIFSVFYQVDVMIIGAILSATEAGLFEAATRILTFLQYAGIAVAAGFAPRLAAGRRTVHDAFMFVQAFRYTTLFYLLLAAPTLVWAEPIVRLMLGAEYAESAEVLRALAPSVVLFGIGEVLAVGVNYIGEARRRVPLAVAALIINTVIDIILIPEIGIVAGAIGTGVAFTVYVGGHVRICQQSLDVSFAPLIPSLLKGLLAAAAASLVLLAFGTSDLSPLDALAGAVLAVLAFVGTLVLVRELKPSELRTGLRLARGQLQRGR
jgi:O-antigen/teichoic acid export membrane protein